MTPVTRETCVCWCPLRAYTTACGRRMGMRPQTQCVALVTCWQCLANMTEWYTSWPPCEWVSDVQELPF